MSVVVLASLDGETFILIALGVIVVGSILARILVSMHEQKKENSKPEPRILGFAPRDKPEPEADIPDRIVPAPGDDERSRKKSGAIYPPDPELPHHPVKRLPPGGDG
tara:strand:- start:5300 stop:5620 length:321 start_codon:yes stop_codon:yes gene_type:complete